MMANDRRRHGQSLLWTALAQLLIVTLTRSSTGDWHDTDLSPATSNVWHTTNQVLAAENDTLVVYDISLLPFVKKQLLDIDQIKGKPSIAINSDLIAMQVLPNSILLLQYVQPSLTIHHPRPL
jgi:hypothetical protein